MVTTKVKNGVLKSVLALLVIAEWLSLALLAGARWELLLAQGALGVLLFLSFLSGWNLVGWATGVGLVLGFLNRKILDGVADVGGVALIAFVGVCVVVGKTRTWARPSPLLLKVFSIELLVPPLAVLMRRLYEPFCVHRETALAVGIFAACAAYVALVPAWYRLLVSLYERAARGARIEAERWASVASWPHVLCGEHLLRAKHARNALFYRDVRCRAPGCDRGLVAGVEKVVGVVGTPPAGGLAVDGGVARVALWDEEARNSRNADIDLLEINEDAGLQSHDRAVGDLVNELKNDVTRRRRWLKRIPVVIKGAPPLDDGTMNMLRAEFREVRREEA